MVAALAGIPFVGPVIDLQWDGTAVLISRKLKKTTERLRLSLPACVGILRGPPLRYHSFLQTACRRDGRYNESIPRCPSVLAWAVSVWTQPKPQKRSLSSTGREVSSQERIEQALGLSSSTGIANPRLLTGDPADVAQKALELVRDGQDPFFLSPSRSETSGHPFLCVPIRLPQVVLQDLADLVFGKFVPEFHP